MIRHRTPALLLALLAPVAAVRGEPAPTKPVMLTGVGRGITLLPDPYFRWTPAEKEPRAGVLGTVEGPTREFESIRLEIGADRRVLTAAVRAGAEAWRIKRVVERGEPQVADVKPELTIVRVRNPFREGVYVTALRQVGRTVVFVRNVDAVEKKHEAALAKLCTSISSTAKASGDDVDGWIPAEVKATFTRTPSGDLLVADDGTLDPARRDEALKVVRDAFALVRRVVGASNVATFPPVVRVTANRDLFAHLAGRRDLSGASAAHVDVAAELIVCPKGDGIDAPGIAAEAAKFALHHAGGVADAEPLRTGLARMAAAAATEGLPAGSLLPAGEEAALERVKAKRAQTWYRLLMLGTLEGFLATDGETRALDAELSAHYLAGGGALGKASIPNWLAGLKKGGHADAAAEAAVVPMDPAKADAEFWAYWTPRANPPKKPPKK